MPDRVVVNPASERHHDLSVKVSIALDRLFYFSSAADFSLELYGANLLAEDVFLPPHLGDPLAKINTLQAKSGRYRSLSLRARL